MLFRSNIDADPADEKIRVHFGGPVESGRGFVLHSDDYVQDSIDYLEGPDKSALATLKDGKGDCHDISALFIALCRTYKVPARMVWVHEHSYPEFCLEDEAGKQYWFPCESAGDRAFGEMPIARTILQKGDSFKMPERPREVLRYASDFATAQSRPGATKPSIKFVRQAL